MKTLLWSSLLLLASAFSAFANNVHPQDLIRFTDEQNQIEQWRLGTTKRWDIFEDYFLSKGQKAYQRCGYLYDLESEEILSFENSVLAFPELEPVLTDKNSQFSASHSEIEGTFNIVLPDKKKHKYVYIYIDLSVNKEGNYIFSEDPNMRGFLERGKAHRQKAATILKGLKTIPWYRIAIPFISFKNQQF
ncbi:hypothetical protein AAEU28_18690 [Pseudoalteromonas sp. SS15]|uniref:hypothetical protein n=1 Tax=Pseudoalteromonas sp. SS15 TaxID=3139393 RepID=UPI003BA8558C